MHNRKSLVFLFRYFFALLTVFMCSYAHAVVINFDDIERVHTDPDDPFWADQELTDQYLSRGLLIDGGYLNSYDPDSDLIVSGKNYLQGGPYFGLTFVGKLPTFVSLIVTSSHEDVVYLNALCGDGVTLSQQTPGWAGPDNNTPFEAKKLITFTSDFGISHIDISAFYFLRTSAMIDDFTYRYSVPEPAAILLFIMGLLGIYGKRINTIRKH